MQDLTYSGLVKQLGVNKVIDYHWNKKFHIPYKKYPKNLGYTSGTILVSLLRRPLKNFDAVVIAASKVGCFETYLDIDNERQRSKVNIELTREYFQVERELSDWNGVLV